MGLRPDERTGEIFFMRRLSLLAVALSVAALLLAAAGRAHEPVYAAGDCAVPGATTALDTEEQAALNAINDLRAQNGLGALTLSPTLERSAQWKSNYMAAGGGFSHDDGFRSWSQRLTDCGYTASTYVSENIAAGVAGGAEAARMWFNSPPHLANILSSSARAIGIARAQGGGYGWYWTADFGAVVDGAAAATTGDGNTAQRLDGQGRVMGGSLTFVSNSSVRPGVAVIVATDDGSCLNLRAGPGLGAQVVTCLPNGTRAMVTGGSFDADGHTWWQLDGRGFAVADYLRLTGN